MGNGEWGMGNGEWGMGNGESVMGNGDRSVDPDQEGNMGRWVGNRSKFW
ncbi:MAG: hypothetical protein F6K26_09930 [Moorea sp. SIO2I5]|nr:hypothetical protein [Moorena sp. SIO2I5]